MSSQLLNDQLLLMTGVWDFQIGFEAPPRGGRSISGAECEKNVDSLCDITDTDDNAVLTVSETNGSRRKRRQIMYPRYLYDLKSSLRTAPPESRKRRVHFSDERVHLDELCQPRRDRMPERLHDDLDFCQFRHSVHAVSVVSQGCQVFSMGPMFYTHSVLMQVRVSSNLTLTCVVIKLAVLTR